MLLVRIGTIAFVRPCRIQMMRRENKRICGNEKHGDALGDKLINPRTRSGETSAHGKKSQMERGDGEPGAHAAMRARPPSRGAAPCRGQRPVFGRPWFPPCERCDRSTISSVSSSLASRRPPHGPRPSPVAVGLGLSRRALPTSRLTLMVPRPRDRYHMARRVAGARHMPRLWRRLT